MVQTAVTVLLCLALAGAAFVGLAIVVAAQSKSRGGKHDIYEEDVSDSADSDRKTDHLEYVVDAPCLCAEAKPRGLTGASPRRW